MIQPKIKLGLLITCSALIASHPAAIMASENSVNTAQSDMTATSSSGDQVVLHANGRWEFVDTKKAVQAAEIAKKFPENQGCNHGEQGGFLSVGRCIPIGDKDFNRGSGIGKGR